MHNASSPGTCSVVIVSNNKITNQYNVIIIPGNYYRGRVQSPCRKINGMMLGGGGLAWSIECKLIPIVYLYRLKLME